MATRIGELKGKIELVLGNEVIDYKEASLNVLIFNGGVKRGKSLQLTIEDGDKTSHIQLDEETALKLKYTLNANL